ETLRNLAGLLLAGGSLAALTLGRYPDFTRSLAELLALRGKKVVLVHFVFDAVVRPEDKPGLWQYLNAEIDEIPLRSMGSYDTVPSGGTTRYGSEFLDSPRFALLLATLKELYDLILISSSALAHQAEGRALLRIVDTSIVAVQQETKEDLAVYCDWAETQGEKRTAFVYLSET
ncbi:MAG: hypothetical protein V4492_07810, partial [Chlamydiota bacterium]